MKYLIALCLLVGSCAATPLASSMIISRQHNAVNNYINIQDPNLITRCFNIYSELQQSIVEQYNITYTNCVQTAENQRNNLTEESLQRRSEILNNSNNVCQNLLECDEQQDGVQFFDCYRNTSRDGYRTLFNLNSEANRIFNNLTASYNAIETEFTQCTDEALVDYVQSLDNANINFQKCLNGEEVVTSTSAPVTSSTASENTPEITVSSPSLPESTSAAPESSQVPENTSSTTESSSALTESTSAATESTSTSGSSSPAPETSSSLPESTESTTQVSASTTEELPEEDLDNAKFQLPFDLKKLLKKFI